MKNLDLLTVDCKADHGFYGGCTSVQRKSVKKKVDQQEYLQ